MSKSRRANSVLFGFDFQVNAAIILLLENIMDLKSLRLEGNFEDIELELSTGEYILAQAKSIEKSSVDFRNVRANLNKALNSLSDGAKKTNAKQLILITNSPNPLNEDASKNLFLGRAQREYATLPDSSKHLIDNYLRKIKHPLDTNKFTIQILPFETDIDAERYKIVRQAIDDFVGGLSLNIVGIGKKLIDAWHNDIFKNGSKKDATIKLKKSDIIWPIMVFATDVERIDDKFADIFDANLYEDIIYKYKDLINSCCERCEFFIKILCDYQAFTTTKKISEKCIDFALTQWSNYKSDFQIENVDEETTKGLIQIILYSIVRNCRVIDRIKRGVQL